MGEIVRLPPRGSYRAWEAGQLAGVSGQKMGQWARRGYIRSSVSPRQPRIYSFHDVAEAMVVHELLDRGVKHRDIRRGDCRSERDLRRRVRAELGLCCSSRMRHTISAGNR